MIDHFAEAERLLKQVHEGSDDWKLIWADLVLREAQVHATLALAAGGAPVVTT